MFEKPLELDAEFEALQKFLDQLEGTEPDDPEQLVNSKQQTGETTPMERGAQKEHKAEH